MVEHGKQMRERERERKRYSKNMMRYKRTYRDRIE
jgi:hypothetical protein